MEKKKSVLGVLTFGSDKESNYVKSNWINTEPTAHVFNYLQSVLLVWRDLVDIQMSIYTSPFVTRQFMLMFVFLTILVLAHFQTSVTVSFHIFSHDAAASLLSETDPVKPEARHVMPQLAPSFHSGRRCGWKHGVIKQTASLNEATPN